MSLPERLGYNGIYITDGDRPLWEIGLSKSDLDALPRRMVAAWNAVAGIETEDLEAGAVAMLVPRDCAEVNPGKRGGVPVLKGTRFTLAQILAEIAGGRGVAELAEDFDLDPGPIRGFLEELAAIFDRPVPESQPSPMK